MIETISEHFGNLTVSREEKHKFLGIDIEFLEYDESYFLLKDYIEESIGLFGEEISTKISSPAKKGIQNIYKSSTKLKRKCVDIFHSIVAKLPWVAKGGRTDIDPAILFLCTRVTKSTNEYKAN